MNQTYQNAFKLIDWNISPGKFNSIAKTIVHQVRHWKSPSFEYWRNTEARMTAWKLLEKSSKLKCRLPTNLGFILVLSLQFAGCNKVECLHLFDAFQKHWETWSFYWKLKSNHCRSFLNLLEKKSKKYVLSEAFQSCRVKVRNKI